VFSGASARVPEPVILSGIFRFSGCLLEIMYSLFIALFVAIMLRLVEPVMRKLKLIFAGAVLGSAIFVGWRIGSCELANFELHDDLRDLAAQGGAQIGLSAPNTEDELRNAVIRQAKEHGIHLEPEQVTVRRAGTAYAPTYYLAADYDARVTFPGYLLTLHFYPTSAK
jgi:hypothetical protein